MPEPCEPEFVARASGEARAFTPDDRVFAVLRCRISWGLSGVLLGALLAGASVHLVTRFDPAAAMRALEHDGLSVMIGTPSMYAMLAEYAGRKSAGRIAAPRLRLISSAGAPLDIATKEAAEAAFGRKLHNGYGITECAPTITLTPLDAPRADCGIGPPPARRRSEARERRTLHPQSRRDERLLLRTRRDRRRNRCRGLVSGPAISHAMTTEAGSSSAAPKR